MKQQKMKTNKETGRSMVEMLGVLAVIGVLSIGGIAGYTMAMNRHRANELLDGASKRAIVAMQQISLGKSASEVSLAEFADDAVAGGVFSDIVLDIEGGEIGIQVSDVEKSVCENLVNMNSSDVGIVKVISIDEVVDMEAEDCSDNKSQNNLAFLFIDAQTGGEGTCTSDSDCSYCQHCSTRKRCVADELCDNSCPSDKPILGSKGQCISCDDRCNGTWICSIASPDECSKCPGMVPSDDGTYCYVDTCPAGYWQWGTSCFDCNDPSWAIHDGWEPQDQGKVASCLAACPNRVIVDDGWGDACGIDNGSGYCSGEGQFIDGWGGCKTCGVDNQYWDPEGGACNQCPGISFSLYNYGDDCVIDCASGFGDNVGRCCNSNEIYYEIGETEYGHPYGACCPETRPNWDGSMCAP